MAVVVAESQALLRRQRCSAARCEACRTAQGTLLTRRVEAELALPGRLGLGLLVQAVDSRDQSGRRAAAGDRADKAQAPLGRARACASLRLGMLVCLCLRSPLGMPTPLLACLSQERVLRLALVLADYVLSELQPLATLL